MAFYCVWAVIAVDIWWALLAPGMTVCEAQLQPPCVCCCVELAPQREKGQKCWLGWLAGWGNAEVTLVRPAGSGRLVKSGPQQSWSRACSVS